MGDETRRLAVVTGASSGIGLELAKQFARHGFDLLVAADSERLVTATSELEPLGAPVVPVQVDLTTTDGVEQLFTAIDQHPLPPDVLVLNAGVGVGGRFVETSWEADRQLLELNVMSTVYLAKLVLPLMVQRRAGRVLVTASIQSMMPGPFHATYSASKAFVYSFAESIRHELKPLGVTVTALLPGPTNTNFFRRANMEDTRVAQAPKDDPADVARDGYEALMAGDDHVVAGSLRNRVQIAAAKVMPDRVVAAMTARQAEPGSADA